MRITLAQKGVIHQHTCKMKLCPEELFCLTRSLLFLLLVGGGESVTVTVQGTVSHSTTLNGASGVAMSANGNYAFVASYASDRLVIVDVSSASSPSITSSVYDSQLNGATYVKLSADGNYAYGMRAMPRCSCAPVLLDAHAPVLLTEAVLVPSRSQWPHSMLTG